MAEKKKNKEMTPTEGDRPTSQTTPTEDEVRKSPSEKTAKKVKKEDIEIVDETEEVGAYKVKKKPKLDPETKRGLRIKGEIDGKRPNFRRQEWYTYKRLGDAWRRPRGLHSKMRKHLKYRTNVVSIGYGSPKVARGLHPSGFKEIMVYNVDDLEKIDPKTEAARIGHSVGMRKRTDIEERADEMGIRVLNRGQ